MITLGQFWRINAVTIAVLIFFVSVTPDTDGLDPAFSITEWIGRLLLGNPNMGDKVAHFLAYGAFGFFATLGWGDRRRDLIAIAAFVAVYGLLLEILQLIGGSRSGDVFDLVANIAGGLCGMIGAGVVSVVARRLWGATLLDPK